MRLEGVFSNLAAYAEKPDPQPSGLNSGNIPNSEWQASDSLQQIQLVNPPRHRLSANDQDEHCTNWEWQLPTLLNFQSAISLLFNGSQLPRARQLNKASKIWKRPKTNKEEKQSEKTKYSDKKSFKIKINIFIIQYKNYNIWFLK